MGIKLLENGKAVSIFVEDEAFEGVKRIAGTVAEDIALVTGVKPAVVSEKTKADGKHVIFAATVGKSSLLESLKKQGVLDTTPIEGKREVFLIKLVKTPLMEGETLVIAGSDKRGTIYGMFALSEYIGVTPLIWWGDAAPAKRPDVEIGKDIETVSKEPSVRYRGFFINDEWPCFGNWVTSHYGDFNAKAYRYVFEFLLRMKGNYMWPAMWSASFPLDGPGSENEELANIYGVVMGYSHHEPCLRASEEWDKVRGEGTRYGNEWNFYTNEEGLLNYWEDSLKRSGKYENIITIGMRGERDSSMLGEDATIEQNVNLLKDIIKKQRGLIKRHVNEDLSQVPQMLALYKEVEAYFYGDGNVAGLKDWDELDGVICMLCEDNFGHMRTLPTEDIRNRNGGFGMYYHFDYHGDPISYEWIDSTPLSKTWEQMCNAYEYGIRDLWIVNVGDLKLHEVPLTYFMALAYDYEKWGAGNPNSYTEYTKQWIDTCFPEADEAVREDMETLFTEYLHYAHMRRPESLNENIYHPCHYGEADAMLAVADDLEKEAKDIMGRLPESERDAYYSMMGFSVSAYMNLLKMHLYAAKNRHYAVQGRPIANRYAALAKECIEKDRELATEFAAFKGGKWSGMEMAPHIGFTKWNEDGCKYPYLCTVEPVAKPRLSVSRADEEAVSVKNYGSPSVIVADDFLSAGKTVVTLELANDGIGELTWKIAPENGKLPEWLSVMPTEGTVTDIARVLLQCHREKLPDEEQNLTLLVSAADTTVAVKVRAKRVETADFPGRTWLPLGNVIAIAADGYCEKKDTPNGSYEVLSDYGKYRTAVKVFPVTADFSGTKDAPELVYNLLIPEEGVYKIELLAAPTNPPVNRGRISMRVTDGVRQSREAVFVDESFRAGSPGDAAWCRGVLDQIRSASVSMKFEAGVRKLTVAAAEPGAVLERILVYKEADKPAPSYFGPKLSFVTK